MGSSGQPDPLFAPWDEGAFGGISKLRKVVPDDAQLRDNRARCTRTDPAPLPEPFIHEHAVGSQNPAAVTPTAFSPFFMATCKPGILYSNYLIFQIRKLGKKKW